MALPAFPLVPTAAREFRLVRLLPVLLLAGCAGIGPTPSSSSSPSPAPKVNLSGYPPQFREGYADGCASIDGRRHRDEARFKADHQYAQGWRDGYDICRKQR